MRRRSSADGARRGVAALELAVILPLLTFLFVLAVDFGRVFYDKFIVVSAARSGALSGSKNPSAAQDTAEIQQKARAEARDRDAQLLEITPTTGTDSAGNPCVDVTVNCPFKMVTSYLVATELNVAGRIRMRVAPVLPNFE